jgi:hypothetical protein
MKHVNLAILSVFLGVQLLVAQDYELKPLSVNQSNSSEIAPFVVDSTLYFVSNRRNSALIAYLNQNMELLYRWYAAPIYADGTVGNAAPFLPNLQTNCQNGPFVFADSGKTIYATQSPKNSSSKQRSRMLIAAYAMTDGIWRPADIKLPTAAAGSLGQPAISADGRYLVFVSSSLGGTGKSDLFVCINDGKAWGEPINMGDVVNSTGNEVFPAFHPSGKLYFSSDGHGGLGGLDVFYTQFENGSWQKPVLLPEPINSKHNDFGFAFLSNGSDGYIASNRNGYDDLFFVKKLWPAFDVCELQVEDNYCFTLFEDGLDQNDTLPIAYRWEFGDGFSAMGKEVDHCFPGPGKYNVTLNAVDTLLKIDLSVVADYELDLQKTEQVYITAPDLVKVGEAAVFNAEKTYITAFEPTTYYWDFGDGEQVKGLKVSHVFKSPGRYVVKCGTVSDSDPTLNYCSSIVVEVVE